MRETSGEGKVMIPERSRDQPVIRPVAELRPRLRGPITETTDTVSFLGIELAKAEKSDSPRVPRRELFKNFIDDEFTLRIQKDIATSLSLGEFVILEGGTSLGKSTMVRRIASLAGYELFTIPCHQKMTVDDVMGKFVPNKERKTEADPPYVFKDGLLTSALRPEPGKKKIAVLEELNAAPEAVQIRLHDILDAYESGMPFVLTENESELVEVDNTKTGIVGLQNSAGGDYIGRGVLDKAFLRRATYINGPDRLPAESRHNYVQGLWSDDRLMKIPGVLNAVDLYAQFHEAAYMLVENGAIGANQEQPFTFDDRVEPRKVRDYFIKHLPTHNGDVTATMQDALRFYYAGKLKSPEDKGKLEGLIEHVKGSVSSSPLKEKSRETQRFFDPELPIMGDPNLTTVERAGMYAAAMRHMPEGLQPPLEKRKSEGPEAIFESEKELREQIETYEKAVWHELLGVAVEVKPLPASITDEVRKKIKAKGMELRYIPAIEFPIETLRSEGSTKFLTEVQERYPNLRPLEGLGGDEVYDPSVPRNLSASFWQEVKAGRVEIPRSTGKWVAIETVEKPEAGNPYEDTPITHDLGNKRQRNYTTAAIVEKAPRERRADNLLRKLGVGTRAKLRLPTIFEYALLANRDAGWGETDVSEWTSTKIDPTPDHDYEANLIAGKHSEGGAGSVKIWNANRGHQSIGYRYLIELE